MDGDLRGDKCPARSRLQRTRSSAAAGSSSMRESGVTPAGLPCCSFTRSQSDLCWLNQVSGDLASTFRIVTFDLRGHGRRRTPLGRETMPTGAVGRRRGCGYRPRRSRPSHPRRLFTRRLYRRGLPPGLRRHPDRRHQSPGAACSSGRRRSTTSVQGCSRTRRKCACPICSRTLPRPGDSCAPAPARRSTTTSWPLPWHGTWSRHPPSAARCCRASSMAATSSRASLFPFS